MDKITALVIEDDDAFRRDITQILRKNDCKVYESRFMPKGIELFNRYHHHLVITDYRMEPINGIEFLRDVKKLRKETGVVIIATNGTSEIYFEAENAGATEFIFRPCPMEELEARLCNAIQLIQERRNELSNKNELHYGWNDVEAFPEGLRIIGITPEMKQIIQNIGKIALTNSTILISGEGGTGKKLVAGAIHYSSIRRARPFHSVKCRSLLNMTLEIGEPGQEKNIYDGSYGILKEFEIANGGSIYLDEIAEMPLEIQDQLIHIFNEGEWAQLNAGKMRNIDTRVIASTTKDLQREIDTGKFRDELFYYLNVIPIQLPPLRERREDIPDIIYQFIGKMRLKFNNPNLAIKEEATEFLTKYHWPGNIRELENVIERACALREKDLITLDEIKFLQIHDKPSKDDESGIGDMDLNAQVEKLEKELIQKALGASANNKTVAANMLGIKTSTLYYKMGKYGIC